MAIVEKTLKRTPLSEIHERAGARMVEFGGWWMPVQFSSILEEHRAVRQRAGLFDVSHMGEIEVRGPGAFSLLQRLLTNDLAKLEIGQAQYTLLCREDGGTLDDLLCYRLGADRYLLVVNAANAERDYNWIAEHAQGVEVIDRTLETALLALQGPSAESILRGLTPIELSSVKTYRAAEGYVAGKPALVARTGYSGENGFEIFLAWNEAEAVWEQLLLAGKSQGLLPAGLGARDTLRLEAGFALYGHELSEEYSPLEADLWRFVALEKGEFIGRQAMQRQRSQGLRRALVGLRMIDPGIPRQGYSVLAGDRPVGAVASGGLSPSLGVSIAMAYVAVEHSPLDSSLAVLIHGRPRRAVVVSRPFYKRPRPG